MSQYMSFSVSVLRLAAVAALSVSTLDAQGTGPGNGVVRPSGGRAIRGADSPSTVLVLQERVLPGQAAVRPVVDASSRRIPSTTSCGASRVCTAGWDLRLLGLTADDSTVAPTGTLSARFTVENRGRTVSDVSEVRLCMASGSQCLGEAAELTIGALQSGERLVVTQPVPAYSGQDVAPPYSLLVRIDPEKATGEVARANNDALIPRIVIDTASLVIETFDVTTTLRADATQVPLTLVVRNASRVAASQPAAIQLGGACGTTTPWADMGTRVPVPALKPGEAWSASVSVRHPSALVKYIEDMPCRVWSGVLPSTKPDAQIPRGNAVQRSYVIQKS